MAAAQSSSWLPWLWHHGKSSDPIATFTENERRRRPASARAADNFRTIATPDRLEGWNPSKLRTCSIVTQLRTLSKSTPGTVLPRSPDTMPRCSGRPFRSLFSLWGTGTAPFNRSVAALPTSGRAAKPAGSLQRLQRLAQALVLDPQGIAELRSCHGRALGQKVEHSLSRLRCFRPW